MSYVSFLPPGPPHLSINQPEYIGGLFWDGRAANTVAQAAAPFQNPNEMNSTPQLVVAALAAGPNAQLFRAVFGNGAFSASTDQVFQQICTAIAAWEATKEVSPFSSKYDAVLAGKATFTASELNGLRLFTGSSTGRPGGVPFKNAQCARCHSLGGPGGQAPDLFTHSSFHNTGVPRNASNPFYTETDAVSNPLGYNPLGAAYIDFGLGDFVYPALGLPSGNGGLSNDNLAIDGKFKTPTLRNVDKRPTPDFVKAYNHSGFFKSLQDVVHFYNARNLTSVRGEVIDFTQLDPYAHLQGKPQFPRPEYPSPATLENPAGLPGRIGNLGLSPQEEADLVNFLRTLSDGFFNP